MPCGQGTCRLPCGKWDGENRVDVMWNMRWDMPCGTWGGMPCGAWGGMQCGTWVAEWGGIYAMWTIGWDVYGTHDLGIDPRSHLQ